MVDAILTTKLYIPPARVELVSRPRLIDRLNEGLTRKLILISAPAGTGKTTLLTEWVGGNKLPAAWVSLDESDNDPTRFLMYAIAALQSIDPDIGAGVLSDLESPRPLPSESILTAFINEVAEMAQEFILVFDDFHLIEARPVQDAISFLVDHLPPQMHLAVASRADPPLALSRLRGRGELAELRDADLRFTPDEAAEFLNQVMELDLSTEEIAALETRTEGWIVGLQMAALSMQGREDATSFIEAFTGSHHFILDYLLEEVLQRQPEGVRSFLLQTSMLDRLSSPLCDAVTGRDDGKAMLEALERSNLFIVPLDNDRQWYRYHRLFADVLLARLMEEKSDQVPALYQRASYWYEQNDLPADAIRHAFAAEDFERAAVLVELTWSAVRRRRQEATLARWLKRLPDELVRARPVLSVYYAAALLNLGDLEAADARLRDAERWLESTANMYQGTEAPAAEMVVVSEEEFRFLPGSIAVLRASHAMALGDLPGAVKYAQRALDLLPKGEHLDRGAAAAILGLAYWASGDLELAHNTFADGVASLQKLGGPHAITGAWVLADIRAAQGRLNEAFSAYEQALRIAADQGGPVLRGTADLHVGISELHRKRGDLEAAIQRLVTSKELGERAVLPETPNRWCIAMARIKVSQGDLDGALDLLDEAERLYLRSPLPDIRPTAAMKAQVWIEQRRFGEAQGWAREHGLSVDDELSYLREYEHLTLARMLIAQHRSDRETGPMREAMGLLERLLRAAEEGERTGSVIEILVLQALGLEAQGDTPAALVPLERALTLAEPEEYVRILVDEGPPMAALLLEATKIDIAPDYVNRLLTEIGADQGDRPAAQSLIEPLSERELEVLRLLRSELTGPEIARELVVSLNTMRTHTKNIYNKLGVHTRRAAISRAEELKLL